MPSRNQFIKDICEKYDLPVCGDIRDDFLTIIQAAEPTTEEKRTVLGIYDDWILSLYGIGEEDV